MESNVKNNFEKMIAATAVYKQSVADALKASGREHAMDNGYGEEEPLTVSVPDDNGSGLDIYELDRARCTGDLVEFHVCGWNGNEEDYWIKSYMLGSDETYAMENIVW